MGCWKLKVGVAALWDHAMSLAPEAPERVREVHVQHRSTLVAHGRPMLRAAATWVQ